MGTRLRMPGRAVRDRYSTRERMMPTNTANSRCRTSVATKVTARTAASERLTFQISAIWWKSMSPHATRKRMPAMAARGR